MPRTHPSDLPRLLQALDLDRDTTDDDPDSDEAWLPQRRDLALGARPDPGTPPDSARATSAGGASSARILSLPAGLRGARWRTRWPAVLGMLLLIGLAGGMWGLRLIIARDDAAPVPIADRPLIGRSTQTFGRPGSTTAAATDQPRGSSAPTGTVGTSGAPSASPKVLVHVIGQVRRPGVVTLPSGARIADAISAAGGSTPSANLAGLNLVQILQDGQQVQVPGPGHTGTVIGGGAGAPGQASGAAGTGAASSGALVDLNTADLAALDSLPGIGPVLAQRILDWRQEHGAFRSVDDLGEVSGIGEKLLAQLRSRVSL
ncbi:MAG: helix-hairpin-helix domain-containing protein [Nostocoides sp.]